MAMNKKPLAIVGMACRLPGARNIDEFWKNLIEKRDCISQVPSNRFEIEKYYSEDSSAQGKIVTKLGGFIDSVEYFDANYFNISPREAVQMDPQQRLSLQVCWDALLDAGITPESLKGKRVGVFVGMHGNDYADYVRSDERNLDVISETGASRNAVAGRISYHLGVKGPSLVVDSDRSSSLVAVHLASQSLQSGECDIALVGGTNLILSPDKSISFSRSKMLSPDGKCKFGDESANGFVRAEGIAFIVLRREEDSKVYGDSIYALVHGSAINHGGHDSGDLMQPSKAAQMDVIDLAHINSGVSAESIQYVEAHGTGTKIGDPIELHALAEIFEVKKSHNSKLLVGSVKTNIGHTESAAGIVGLIKTALALKHKLIPASLHFKKPNPAVNFETSCLEIISENKPWPAVNGKSFAGVSSFGLTGINAHVILGDNKSRLINTPEPKKTIEEETIVVVSAKTKESLKNNLAQVAEKISVWTEESGIRNVAKTLALHRPHYSYRASFAIKNLNELKQAIGNFSVPPNQIQLDKSEVHKPVFMFTGQGSQYFGMTRELYQKQPVFWKHMNECAEILKGYLEKPLLDVLYFDEKNSGLINQTMYSQPALFAIEYSLSQMWKSWGVEPSAVMGHSVGEFAAATVAGVMSLEDGLKLISARGRLMQALPSGGEMVVVFASDEVVKPYLKGYEQEVSVGAVNGPENTVISGVGSKIQEIISRMSEKGVKTHQLVVSHAFHSPLMEPMLKEFAEVAKSITYHRPSVDYVSNLTGEVLKFNEQINADYWVRHVREAVEFSRGVKALESAGYRVFLEIGPNPVLIGMAQKCVQAGDKVWVSSLQKGRSENNTIYNALGKIYNAGYDIDWLLVFKGDYQRVSLPSYGWDEKFFWAGNHRAIKPPQRTNSVMAVSQKVEQEGGAKPPSSADPSAQYIELLRQEVGRILGLENINLIDIKKSFKDLGMTSLMSMELKESLEAKLGRAFSSSLIFDHPNIERLANHLSGKSAPLPGTIGNILLEKGLINQTQLEEALAEQKRIGGSERLGSILVRLGYLTVDKLQRSLAHQLAEPVAIIGMACRFPGNINTPEEFWSSLKDGLDAITEVDSLRWDWRKYYDPEPGNNGKTNTKWAGQLTDVDRFDAKFFEISASEACLMDPQQRIALEVAWEALESAGVNPLELEGTRTGVYLGVMNNDDYAHLKRLEDHPEIISGHDSTGNAMSVIAGRISYFLGANGPALAIDTACSSSLVAIHTACQSLRSGESTLALAGGVNLILSPTLTIAFSKAGMMSSDGRCKTFDESANGYVRSEGCGFVVLKRLSHALSDGDNILAVIAGSAVNQDGRSSGLTAPSGPAQQSVIKDALGFSGTHPAHVGYVECHGTGTSLGDPIEVNALSQVYCAERPKENRLVIGSVKTNLGHMEAAAGVGGVMKVVLSMQHKMIPANLHFKRGSPHIDWEKLNLEVPTRLMRWPSDPVGNPLSAAVSSFGFSGTNAHVLLEEAPRSDKKTVSFSRSHHVLSLSAKSKKSLLKMTLDCIAFLKSNPDIPLEDVCYTYNACRAKFNFVAIFSGETREDLIEEMLKFENQTEKHKSVLWEQLDKIEPGWISFLFTGQGSQYFGMSKDLYESQPIFRRCMNECADILKKYLEKPLLDILYFDEKNNGLVNQTMYSQPALFAIEYSLSQMWKSWGVEPSAVMGHSVGEFAAATVAGVMSLEDGLKLISARGRIMQSLPAGGEMVVVFANDEVVKPYLKGYEKEVSIGAVNGPENTVISGAGAKVQEIISRMSEKGIKTHQLVVSHAFHSPLMEPMLREFGEIAKSITYHRPTVDYVSNVTGEVLKFNEQINADYWVRHVREAVEFSRGVKSLELAGYRVFLEIGPNPVLIGMAQKCIEDKAAINQKYLWLTSIQRGKRDWSILNESMRRMVLRGTKLDWKGYHSAFLPNKISVPNYPFERERFWLKKQPVRAAFPGENYLPTNINEKMTYEKTWVSIAADKASFAAAPTILISLGANELSKIIMKRVEAAGKPIFYVRHGDELSTAEGNIYTINTVSKSDWSSFFQLALSQISEDKIEILILLGSEMPRAYNENFLNKIKYFSKSCFYIAKTAAEQVEKNFRLSIVKDQFNSDDEIKTAYSAVDGLMRTINLEKPDWEVLVAEWDVNVNEAESNWPLLGKDIYGNREEIEVRYAEGQRYGKRILPVEVSSNSKFTVDGADHILITGGFGGIGRVLAKALVEHGAKLITLMGRNEPKDFREMQAEFKEKGAELVLALGSVADNEFVNNFFRHVSNSAKPVSLVFHCAGAFRSDLLEKQSWAHFEDVYEAKVKGAINLHSVTTQYKVKNLVLFSSISSFLGYWGEASYGAANAFLDGLQELRKGCGLSTTVVNWGAWSDVGALTNGKIKFESKFGIGALASSQYLKVLFDILVQMRTNILVALINWPNYLASVSSDRFGKYLEGVAGVGEIKALKTSSNTSGQAKDNFTQVYHQLPVHERLDFLKMKIKFLIGEILGIAGEQIEEEKPLMEIGLDSLHSIDFRNKLGKLINKKMAASLIFNYPNVKALASYVSEFLGEPAVVSISKKEPALAEFNASVAGVEGELLSLVGQIQEMNHKELDNFLEQELKKSS